MRAFSRSLIRAFSRSLIRAFSRSLIKGSCSIGLLISVLLAGCGGGSSGGGAPQVTVIEPVPPPPQPDSITTCINGMAGEFPCSGINLQENIPLDQFGAASANDIWGWVSGDGREVAIIGLSNGVAFVDVTSPDTPVIVGTLPTESSSSLWRDIKVYQDHAYIVADNAGDHGVQVFDLKRLQDAGTDVTFTADVVYGDISHAHNIAVNEDSGYGYVVGSETCAGGLHMINLAEPINPLFAGCHTDSYTHDVQCVNYLGPDTDYEGAEICFAANEDHLAVVDVSMKFSTATLSMFTYPNLAYAHQAWATEDHRYLLVDDELDERSTGSMSRTVVVDVQDLDNPEVLYVHEGNSSASDHNLYISGKRVFEANYTSGLRVLEFDDLQTDTLMEIAYFDTYPENDGTQHEGAWSVFPFFPSGTLVVSDINRGLFVLTLAE